MGVSDGVDASRSERAFHDEVAQPYPQPLDLVLADDAKAAALKKWPRRQARLGEQPARTDRPRARLDLAQQPRGDAHALVHVVGIEAVDPAAALEVGEADDLSVRLGDVREGGTQLREPARLVGDLRGPGIDLLGSVVAAVDLVHGVVEEPHDLQQVGRLEVADAEAGEGHGQNPAMTSILLPSAKRPKRYGAGSTMGGAPDTRSAIRRPAPGPMPKPWPEKPVAMKKPGNGSTGEITGTASGVTSI